MSVTIGYILCNAFSLLVKSKNILQFHDAEIRIVK